MFNILYSWLSPWYWEGRKLIISYVKNNCSEFGENIWAQDRIILTSTLFKKVQRSLAEIERDWQTIKSLFSDSIYSDLFWVTRLSLLNKITIWFGHRYILCHTPFHPIICINISINIGFDFLKKRIQKIHSINRYLVL